MSAEDVLKKVEKTIGYICSDVRKKKGNIGTNKIDSIAKLVNSYSRLLDKTIEEEWDYETHGDSYFPESLEKRV